MEQVRCFIAIELPDEVRAGLSHLQAQLKSGDQLEVKWVDPYSIHLTLKFLGNVGVAMIDSITEAIEKAAQGVSPFRLKVEKEVVKETGFSTSMVSSPISEHLIINYTTAIYSTGTSMTGAFVSLSQLSLVIFLNPSAMDMGGSAILT